MSMTVGKKIGSSYQQLSLRHQPQVGSDWLERRVDVIPWTGHRAQKGEVHKVSYMWSSPACLLSVCVCVCWVHGLTADTFLGLFYLFTLSFFHYSISIFIYLYVLFLILFLTVSCGRPLKE